MAWTSPRTWIVGELVTAAMLNQHLRDNLMMTETQAVTTQGDLIVGTGPTALTRQPGIGVSQQIMVVAGPAIGGQDIPIPDTIIAFFTTVGCPAGWSEVAALRGRSPLGLPSGGALAGSVGAALGNLGARTLVGIVPSHNHGMGTIAAANSGEHSHYHGVGSSPGYTTPGWTNTQMFQQTSTDGSHSHSGAGGITENAMGAVDSVDVTMPYIQYVACTPAL